MIALWIYLLSTAAHILHLVCNRRGYTLTLEGARTLSFSRFPHLHLLSSPLFLAPMGRAKERVKEQGNGQENNPLERAPDVRCLMETEVGRGWYFGRVTEGPR